MIEHYAFGTMRVDGAKFRDDVKIIGGKAKAGWWRRRGHYVEILDVKDIFDARPRTLVIGTGASNLVKIDPLVESRARELGIELVAKPTREAVDAFNQLERQGVDVAGAFHLTC